MNTNSAIRCEECGRFDCSCVSDADTIASTKDDAENRYYAGFESEARQERIIAGRIALRMRPILKAQAQPRRHFSRAAMRTC